MHSIILHVHDLSMQMLLSIGILLELKQMSLVVVTSYH